MKTSNESNLRSEMLIVAQKLVEFGLNRGTSGNVSVRLSASTWLVTPSGVPVDALSTESMVLMDFEKGPLGDQCPSSEWRLHHDILMARSDVGAVVHTHSRFATSFSCLQQDIPAFHYMIAAAGGDSLNLVGHSIWRTR